MMILGLSGKNGIDNIDALSEMTELQALFLDENEKIEDINPLSNANKLKTLALTNNRVKEIEIIKNYIQLETLFVGGNCITDFSPIENLKENGNLTTIYGATAEEQDYARCQ